MWKPKPETENWEAPAGVGPWRDLTDEEFAEIEATYDAQFTPEQKGSLRRWFDHTKDSRKTATGDTAGAGR